MMLDKLSVKETNEIRSQFLREVYKASHGTTNKIIQMWDIGKALKLGKQDTQSITEYLTNENLIKHETIGGGIRLTHDGLLVVENYLDKKENLKNKNDQNLKNFSDNESYRNINLSPQNDILTKTKKEEDPNKDKIHLGHQKLESPEMESTNPDNSKFSSNTQNSNKNEVDYIEKTYLLAYDPERFEFANMRDTAIQVIKNGKAKSVWSCGQSNLPAKARVYLIRHGDKNPGIIASGLSISESHKAPHWDPEKKSKGEQTNFINVSWDTFRKFPLLSLKKLEMETNEKELWIRRDNGMRVKSNIARRLEIAWQKAKGGDFSIPSTGGLYAKNDTPPCSSIAGRENFEATEQDCLDVSTQAKAFSTLLVSKDVKAPIALALLGDWGVGKTHFMRIMQETIQLVANKDSNPTDKPESVSRAVQIEFNAWHYVDTDLWASLASHIFDELAVELKHEGDIAENVRLELRKKIHSSGQEIKNAEAAVEAAKKERNDALNQLEQAQNIRTDKIQAVWNALTDDNNQNKCEKVIGLKNNTIKIVKNLGIDKTLESAKDLEKIYKSLQDIKKRGLTLVGFIDTLFSIKRWKALAISLIFVLFFLLGFPLIVDHLNVAFLKKGLTSFLIQTSALISPIIIWTSKNISSVSKAMGYLESIQEVLQSPPKGLEGMKAQIAECDATVLAEEQRVIEAEHEISRAMAEIQRINSGGLVYDFIKNKKIDSRYIERMGLISVIRKDFEELKTLLADWNINHELSNINSAKPIERIILYIDDLDRCPTQRVVEVLQAVHLLLAFDLFNVVVAVDARWLERSLNEAYNPSKTIKNTKSYAELGHRFSAHNYLEKIFQIPFSLPIMEEKGYQDLIENLVNHPDAQFKLPRIITTNELQNNHPIEETGSGNYDGIKIEDLIDDTDPKIVNSIVTEEEANAKRIQAMKLFDHEKIFISALYRFIPTPRLANRFINIYRLLRVRAESLNIEMQTFLNQETGEYRAVLLLLAISIGYPKHAPKLFEELDNTENNFLKWLAKTRENYTNEINLDLYSQNNKNGERFSANAQKNNLSQFENTLKKIENNVDTVIQSLVDLGGSSIEADITHYMKWAKEVGRYSFR